MKSMIQKIHSYCRKKFNHFISPLYEHYYEKLDFSDKIKVSENSCVVASLTSYPARFSTLHICLKSILNQSYPLKKVVLYLDDFINNEQIPQKILDLRKNGLEIRKIPYDLNCHKKYFFALREFQGDAVITFDDDVIYRRNDVKKLVRSYKRFPGAVNALRVHKIVQDKNSGTASYNLWEKEYTKIHTPDFSLCAVGVGGILYPPKIFPEEIFDVELIKKTCYKADDIYLKYMEDKYNIPVVYVKNSYNHPVDIAEQCDTGLSLKNVGQNINDEYIKLMASATGISLAQYKPRKITFITGHNWFSKRQGGFHQFARAASLSGAETVFFSFPRPYYGYFMKREQINANVIRRLKKGVYYANPSVLNVCFPTFRLPDAAGKFLPDWLMNFLLTHSFVSFKKFCKNFLVGTDCFVFESCDGIALLSKIKKFFPDAKIIYRPSDPLVFASVPARVKELEKKMLFSADMNLIVNNEGLDAYKKELPDFEQKAKFKILSNGIEIESYKKTYPVPPVLENKKTVLYVGAWEVEWNLLFLAAEKIPDAVFVVVCPNYPSKEIQQKASASKNIIYIPGILPGEVPAWITNASVVMVPYVTDFYKDRPLGITAKYYQAMAANKPIVAYCDTSKLKDVGIPVTYSYEDFILAVKYALGQGSKKYSFDLAGRDWKVVCRKFLEECE